MQYTTLAKARVERAVQHVQTSMWAGEVFTTLAAARETAAIWCRTTAGQRDHGTTHQQPATAFAQHEQAHLLPCPTEPYDIARWGKGQVGRDQMLIVDKVLYSMPSRLVGKTVEYRVDRSTVKAYLGAVLVKVHARGTVGTPTVDPNDYPDIKASYALRDTDALLRQAQSHGNHVAQFARQLLDHPQPWARVRQVYRLLGLCKSHGSTAVDGACKQLLALQLVEVGKVANIIDRGKPQDELPPSPQAPSGGRVIPLRFARAAREFAVKSAHTEGSQDDAS